MGDFDHLIKFEIIASFHVNLLFRFQIREYSMNDVCGQICLIEMLNYDSDTLFTLFPSPSGCKVVLGFMAKLK